MKEELHIYRSLEELVDDNIELFRTTQTLRVFLFISVVTNVIFAIRCFLE